MKSLYVQLFYDGCPEFAPLIGTKDYPVFQVGYYFINYQGEMNFIFPYPDVCKQFEGKMVNIWIEDLEDKIIRNVLFSKKLRLPES